MATAALIGAVALTAASQLQAGKAAQEAGLAKQAGLEHQAAQGRQAAGQERAAAQRAAGEQSRQARLLSSRTLARAAGSGAGAADPTVENILGDIGEEGEFRALNELFLGEERARGLETRADLDVFEGQQERRAGDTARKVSRFKAGATVLGGASGLSRFGSPTTQPGLSVRARTDPRTGRLFGPV